MSIEQSREQKDREKKIKSETEQKEELAKSLEFKKEKEVLFEKLDKQKQLSFLKSLVERGLLGVHAAEMIASDNELVAEEIEAIFAKIDEIENVKEIDRILPADLRLSKDEYAIALSDQEGRTAALAKLDAALGYIFHSSNPNSFSPASIFYSFFAVLNRNLVLVQEHTIDIKRSLVSTNNSTV